jgi:hypothetical protein
MDDMMSMIGQISDLLFRIKTVSQGSDESLASCRPSKVIHTSSINSQSGIRTTNNIMSLIKGHTH